MSSVPHSVTTDWITTGMELPTSLTTHSARVLTTTQKPHQAVVAVVATERCPKEPNKLSMPSVQPGAFLLGKDAAIS